MTSLTTDEKALLRSTPVLPLRGQYLSVAPREAVFQAQVNGAPLQDTETLGYYAVAYDNVAFGAYTDVGEDMSVDFGTTFGGRELGTTRVRYLGADTNYLYFTESAPAKLPIVDDCYITVVKEYRPWMVMPRGVGSQNGVPYTNDITMFMDYDQDYVGSDSPTIFFRPKANITRSSTSLLAPKPAGFVDGFRTVSEQTYRTVTLSAAQSFTFTVSAFINLYDWDVDDGTIITGTSTSETITVRFPVGFRYITLTVTDSAGVSRSMHYPIWCHDDSYMPLTHFTYGRNVTNEWREMEIEFFVQDTSPTTIPRGTALCYWKIPYFTPVPEAYRDQFFGWAKEDTTLFRKYQSRMTLTIQGIGAWLDDTRCFPLRVYNPDPSPVDTWFEMYTITLDRLIFYVLEFLSSATRIGNLLVSNIDDELKSLDITGNSVWQQIKYIALGSSSRAAADSLNGIWIRRHYSYLTTTQRAAVTPLIGLTNADWLDSNPPRIMRRERDPVGWLIGTGSSFDAPTANIYKAGAPGRTQADGAETQDAPFQNLPFADAQDTLNWLTGQHLAYINNERENVPFDLLYPLDCIEPAWMIPISASTDDSDSGLELNGDLFIVKEVNLNYGDPREREQVSWVTEGETIGDEAQMMEVDVNEYTPPDSEPPPEIDFPWEPPTGGSRLPEYTIDTLPTRLFIADSGSASAHIATAWNPLLSSLVYTDISTGLSGDVIDGVSDPFDYRGKFLITTDGLYHCVNVWAASPSWTQVASNATMLGGAYVGCKIMMSINRRGWIIVLSGVSGRAVSFDYGTSWDIGSVHDGGASFGTTARNKTYCDVAVSCFNNGDEGWLYSVSGSPYTFSGTAKFCKSVDWGLTWSVITSGAAVGAVNVNANLTNTPRIAVGYKRVDGSTDNINDSAQEIILACGEGNYGNVRFNNAAGTGTWISKADYNASNIVHPTAAPSHRPLVPFTYDMSKIMFMYERSSNNVYLHPSANIGASGTDRSVTTHSGTSYFNVNGFPIHKLAALMFSSQNTTIYWTVDDGATIQNAAAPAGYAGVAVCEWDISTLVAAA